MEKIYLLTDYRGRFGSKHDDSPYRSGMDHRLLEASSGRMVWYQNMFLSAMSRGWCLGRTAGAVPRRRFGLTTTVY